MTLSGIITTKTSKSPGKSKEVQGNPESPGKFGGGFRSGNKVSQNTFKNTPEDDLDTFCDIISHLTSKYRPGFLRLENCWTDLVRTLTSTSFL